MLRYLEAFQASQEGHCFYLVTFEQKEYWISPDKQKKIKSDLASKNIYWTPFDYHGGRLLILMKLLDFVQLFGFILKLKIDKKVKTIIGFTSLSGVLAFIYSKLLRIKLLALNIEPHSDYMLEFGIWKKYSLSYLILQYLETSLLKYGDYVALPTKNATRDFSNLRKKDRLDFVPTCIDVLEFKYQEDMRTLYRQSLNVNDDALVIVYLGKFDGLYFSAKEMANYMFQIEKNTGKAKEVFWWVITPDNVNYVKSVFESSGLVNFHIQGKIPFKSISSYLSAADAGLLILPEYPSQQYRCPIKTANYLACGLPIIVNEIVGDEAEVVRENDIGWVLNLLEPNLKEKVLNSREVYSHQAENYRGMKIMIDYLIRILD
ncbi:MAG: hypothetical protein JXR03_06850 [Cyclobacteriaceae bacterium]